MNRYKPFLLKHTYNIKSIKNQYQMKYQHNMAAFSMLLRLVKYLASAEKQQEN